MKNVGLKILCGVLIIIGLFFLLSFIAMIGVIPIAGIISIIITLLCFWGVYKLYPRKEKVKTVSTKVVANKSVEPKADTPKPIQKLPSKAKASKTTVTAPSVESKTLENEDSETQMFEVPDKDLENGILILRNPKYNQISHNILDYYDSVSKLSLNFMNLTDENIESLEDLQFKIAQDICAIPSEIFNVSPNSPLRYILEILLDESSCIQNLIYFIDDKDSIWISDTTDKIEKIGLRFELLSSNIKQT